MNSDATGNLRGVLRGLALFITTLVYFSNFLFLFFVMPRIADMLAAVHAPGTGFAMASLPIGLGQFTRAHVMISLALFLSCAIGNGWAVCQPSSIVRKRAWLAMAFTVLFSVALFITSFVIGVNAAMAGDNSPDPPVVETFAFPGGEIITNESQTNDVYSANHLFYQPSPFALRQSLGEVDQEESPISLRESKPLILRDGNRMAIVIGAHVFETRAQHGTLYWDEMTTKPDAVVMNFLIPFLKPDDPSVANGIPLDVEGYFNKSQVNYVFDHLDLDQNVLVTRLKTRDTTFPQFLVYSAPQYGFPLVFDLERTRTANNLPPK
jgi:hypothetical protein